MSTIKKLKRGDVHPETGKVFWAYGKACANGEYWLSPDAFVIRRDAAAENQKVNRELRRESARRWKERNRETVNAKRRADRKADLNKARALDRKYNATGSERSRRYRERNAAKLLEINRAYQAKRRAEDYDLYIGQKRAWYTSNREVINAKRRAERCSNPLLGLKNRLRARTAFAFQRRGYSKTSNTRLIIGCDWADLKTHIESRFSSGMTWENRHLWHVDHIIPLARAETERELISLCHFTNLQPLWAFENISKGAKIQIAA